MEQTLAFELVTDTFTSIGRATTITIHSSSAISIHIIVVLQMDFPSPSVEKHFVVELAAVVLIATLWKGLNLED